MKFLVDAHLPPSLAALLVGAGHDAVHKRALPAQNQTRDRVLNELSLSEQRVVVTKDTDFFYSHILQGRPWKLLLVRTGNNSHGRTGCAVATPSAHDHRGAANAHPRGNRP